MEAEPQSIHRARLCLLWEKMRKLRIEDTWAVEQAP